MQTPPTEEPGEIARTASLLARDLGQLADDLARLEGRVSPESVRDAIDTLTTGSLAVIASVKDLLALVNGLPTYRATKPPTMLQRVMGWLTRLFTWR